jgi:hypothetical protein
LKPNPGADVITILRGLRRRLIVREGLDALAIGALAGAGGLLIVEAVRRVGEHREPISFSLAIAIPLAAALLFALLTLTRTRSVRDVAVLADRRGSTKDRLVTALALADEKPGEISALARAECAAWLSRADFRPLFPLHAPRLGVWLIVPFVALGLLRLDFVIGRGKAIAEAREAQAAIADTTRQIEELARKVEQLRQQDHSEELRKLSEQLQQSAEKLRAETKPADAEKAALRELSSLEEMMRELQRQPSPAEEMKELAKALAQVPGMQDVLKALNEKNLEEAQRALEQARDAQKTAANPPNEEQVEKTLRDAMQNLAERRQLSQALQNLVQQMNQQGGSPSQQAMQQLQQMMQQAQQNSDQQGDGSGQRQMTMQELISALENMKASETENPDQKHPGGDQPGQGQRVTVQAFGQNSPGAPRQPGDASAPSGKPGSEHDLGTSETPFGEKNAAQDHGRDLALKGQLGQGESLSMMLPSAGDQSRAAQRYKALYDAAAAAAQDSVQQENIPLGSRFLIKRYFESIRPSE